MKLTDMEREALQIACESIGRDERCGPVGLGALCVIQDMMSASDAAAGEPKELPDDLIEQLALKHIAPRAKQFRKEFGIDGSYAETEQFRRVKAFAIELAQQFQAEIDRLHTIINTPHADDFIRAVSIEAEHQRQRWGSEHDTGKTPADWFWLVGYLAGKALHAHAAANVEKAEHHIITTAAACANWHRAMFGKTDMRPGIDGGALLRESEQS